MHVTQMGDRILVEELERRGYQIIPVTRGSSPTVPTVDTPAPASTTLDMHVFDSGAKRSMLKPRYDLVPVLPLKRLADRYALGAKVYGEWNWQMGLPAGDTLNHIIDHLLRWSDNLRHGRASTDDDLAAAAWGCFTLMALEPTYDASQMDRGPRVQGGIGADHSRSLDALGGIGKRRPPEPVHDERSGSLSDGSGSPKGDGR